MQEKYKGATPGPWRVRDVDMVIGPDDDYVCQLWGKDEYDFRPNKETTRNAKLIADAPMLAEQNEKMLAMLKKLSEIFHNDYLSVSDFVSNDVDQLIAEVEGK